MSLGKNTLTADRTAATQLAKEAYDNGVTDLSELEALDDTVADLNQDRFEVPVFYEDGEQGGTVEVRNIGHKAVQEAMGVHSESWQNPEA